MFFAKHLYLFIILLLCPFFAATQEYATVYGKITDARNKPLEAVNVAVFGYPGGAITDKKGNYELKVPAGKSIRIMFSYIGFGAKEKIILAVPGSRTEVKMSLQRSTKVIEEFEVIEELLRSTTMKTLDPKVVSHIPSAGGHFEAVLRSQPGVMSNNELSSQYSVRGGNFDENLVYVNDIEIYRPFLVRSGQQEGLSFINGDLVSSISFSSGGFAAQYGDKMSSVLDITYKEPKEFGGSVSMSLLGGAIHIEDASENYRFTQIHGFRYMSNRYVLNSLNTTGDYRPTFTDYQGFFTYDISPELELNLLANYSRNKYRFVPETRESEFGTINEVLRLTVYFDGQEIDDYETFTGAFSFNYRPRNNVLLKFISSGFRTKESENYDLQGQYHLDELERDLSKDNFGDVAFNRGVGTFLNHARNYLDATVLNVYHKGKITRKKTALLWGARYQREYINDEIREWEMLDSAGYSLSHPADSIGYTSPALQPLQEIVLNEFLKAENNLTSNRLMGYLQQNIAWTGRDTSEFTFTGGMRFNYWDFNKEFLFGPRVTFSFKPNWKRDLLFRASWGYYHQPAFYREMRDFNGNINKNIKAQTSIHYLLGSDYNLKIWNRPFKFITEIYYKQLKNLIPYEIDNVRIRYYATNNAKGYATGIDMKLNGEFVKDVESWVSLSVMQTKEDILDDYYYEYYNQQGEKIISGYTFDNVAVDSVRFEPGYIPRPTDQRVTFGLFFQDYLPKNPTYKMHLNLLFGSGLPFGPPTLEKHKDTLRIPPYRRVDIGFSKQLLSENKELKEKNPFRHFKSIWLSLEVFNLLQINNTISYIWIKDVTNRQYAVPNYLTARRLNLKLIAKF